MINNPLWSLSEQLGTSCFDWRLDLTIVPCECKSCEGVKPVTIYNKTTNIVNEVVDFKINPQGRCMQLLKRQFDAELEFEHIHQYAHYPP